MASSKVKGITVEIGGDTTKLGKAIEDSEKQARSLQGELRQVERLLKFDPTNTELLAQKQKILTDSVEATTKKLDTLKEAESQVAKQFESGEIGEEQYRAFQRELIKTKSDLDTMESDLKDATRNLEEFADNNGVATEKAEQMRKAVDQQNKKVVEEKQALKDAEQALKDHEKEVDAAKDKLEEYGDKAKEAGDKVKTGLKAAGAAIVGAGTYAVKTSVEFDKAYNTLQTRTGATNKQMKKLEEVMKDVYNDNFGESMEDVADTMAIVKTNTKASTKQLKGLTENALLLRDVFDFDVNESTRSAKMLMDQFGISGDEAYTLIAQGAQNGLDKNGDLLDTINEYSVHYKQLGYNSEEMFNSLLNGAESGTFSIDKLGDAMKEFGIRAKDTATSTDEGYELLNLDADKMRSAFAKGGDSAKAATDKTLKALFSMKDEVKQNQAGVDLFGTMWEDLGKDGVKALMNVNGKASKTSETLKKMNEQKYDDLGSSFEELGRTMKTDIIDPLGDDLKPVVDDVVQYVKDNAPEIKQTVEDIATAVGDLISWLIDNSSEVLAVIAGIAAGLIAWNVVSMINGVVTAIKAFKTANEGATVAQAMLNAVLNANPLMLIVTVITAVIAAVVTFIATNKDAQKKLKEVWDAIVGTVSNVIEAIVEFFTVTIPEAFSDFVDTVGEVVTSVVDWFKKLPGRIWNAIKSAIKSVGEWAIKMKDKAVKGIKTLVSAVVNWFKKLPKRIWNAIVGAVMFIGKWATKLNNKAADGVSKVVKTVVNWFKKLPKRIWNAIVGAVIFIGKWASKLNNKAADGVSKVIKTVINWFKKLPGRIWNAIVGAVTSVGKWCGKMKNKAASGIKTVVTAVVNGFKGLPKKMWDIGGNLVKGLWKGIKNLSKWVVNKVKGFGKSILGGLKKFFGIHSPSKVFEKEIGEQLANGLVKGIENKKAYAKKKSSELAEIVVSSAKTRIKSMKQANKVTEADEVAFWRQIAKHTKKGSKAYREATDEMNKAKNTLNSSVKKLDKEYATNVKSVKEQLIKDIQEVTTAYDTAIKERQSQITSSLSLFDAFTAKDKISKEDLTKNLQSQVDGLTRWDKVLDSLSKRKIPKGLLTELQDMGVDSVDILESINSMSDEELKNYVKLWKKKNSVAKERAEAENEDLKKSTKKQIKTLIKKANEQLDKLENTYKKGLKKLGVTAKDQSKEIGENIVKGLKNGISSQSSSLNKFLKKFFGRITSTAKKSLDIHSPSRVFRDTIGKNIVKGLSQGIDDNASLAIDSMNKLSNSLINGATVDRQLDSTFGGTAASVSDLIGLMQEYLPKLIDASQHSIVLDSGTLVGETINTIDQKLGDTYSLKRRRI